MNSGVRILAICAFGALNVYITMIVDLICWEFMANFPAWCILGISVGVFLGLAALEFLGWLFNIPQWISRGIAHIHNGIMCIHDTTKPKEES